MTIKEKISQYLDAKGISDYKMEKDISVSKGYWNKCKNPTAEIIDKITGIYTDISADWLLRGEGPMLKTDASHTEHTKESVVIDMAQDSSAIYERMIEKKDKRIEELALMVGNLQKEVEMLKQDKKIAQEADDASNAAERPRLTGTDDR